MPEDPPEPGIIWPWRGPVHPRGYGQFCHNYRTHKAHRVSYELFRGAIPAGMIIRHVNDTPIDVNPWNLLVGTQSDNMADRVARSRQPRGASHYATRLTEDDVIEIRRLYATGSVSHARIAAQYGVKRETIRDIIAYKRWKHI
jgi:hypothetical protein